MNEDSKPETWEYKGWNFLEITSWEQIGSTKITEMHTILESINPVVQEIMEGPMLNQLNTPADDSNCFYNIRKNKNEARSDSLYNYSFINVKPGEVFQGSAKIGGGSMALFTFWDEEGNVTGYYGIGNNQTYDDLIAIAPPQTTQMGFAWLPSEPHALYRCLFDYGRMLSELESRIDDNSEDVKNAVTKTDNVNRTISEITEQVSKNIFNGETVGGYIDSNGIFRAQPSEDVYAATNFIRVKPNTYYYISNRDVAGTGEITNIRCLDENKANPTKVRIASTGEEYMDWYTPNMDGTKSVDNGPILTSPTAAYLQMNLKFNYQGNPNYKQLMLEEIGDTYNPTFEPSPYEAYKEETKIKRGSLPELESEEGYKRLSEAVNELSGKTNELSQQVEDYKQTKLKVLLIGSSHGMNTMSQFPWIAYKSNIDVTVGNVYKGSLSLQQIAQSIKDKTEIGGWFKVFSKGKWMSLANTEFSNVINYTEWDYIILQRSASYDENWDEVQSEAMGIIINEIISIAKNTPNIVFNSGFADPKQSAEEIVSQSNAIINSAKQMQAEFQLDIIPVVTAIQNARKTSLSSLGNYQYHNLCYDSQHLDYGIGCYVAGITLFQFFFGRIGISALTAKGYASYEEAKQFVGNLVDSGGEKMAYTEPTDETILIAKYCAMAACRDMDTFSMKLEQKYPAI